MTRALEVAAQRPPSIAMSFAIAAAWTAGLFLALVGLAIVGSVR
jgi:hypothetical protein